MAKFGLHYCHRTAVLRSLSASGGCTHNAGTLRFRRQSGGFAPIRDVLMGRHVVARQRRPKDPTIAPMIVIGDPRDGNLIHPMSYLTKQRIIFVGERITDTVATNVVASLLAMEAVDTEAEISLYLNSGGGVPYAIMSIIDTIKVLRCPVSTVALGCCMAPSSLLLAAGTKGRRYSMPNARIMMHQPQGGAQGTSYDFTVTTKEMNRTMRVMQAMYSEFSKMTLEEAEEATDRITFMGPKRAMELGLIDAVL